MSSAALPLAPTTTSPSATHSLRIFVNEVRYEVLRSLRTRAFSLSAIGFPVMFYILFGLVMNRAETIGGVSVAKYMLGGYAVFGALGAAIFGIGVGVALDLQAGWLELKQASPMPPLAYVLSKVTMAMVFSLIIACILTVLGMTAGHVHITGHEFSVLLLLAAAGAVPFSCLGLALAFWVPPNSAGGIANLVYLPMSFLSGLWIPIGGLPMVLQKIAPAFPTYHLAQLMYRSLGAPDRNTMSSHILGLIGATFVFMGIAWIGYGKSAERS